MYFYVQFNPNKKERWTLVSTKQTLDKPPAFQTVLAVSQNPDDYINQGEDPNDFVKYQGPMYFDLDGPSIGEVLKSAKDLILMMEKDYDIPREILSCYLSGKKGVHITFPQQAFGISSAVKNLPLIYGKFAENFPMEHIDRGVYSMGKGRMWRTEGIKRPDSGTYKVGVSATELIGMTEEEYFERVSSPRPPLAVPTTPTIPKLSSLFKTYRELVAKMLLAKKRAESNISNEDLQAYEGIPGCIDILITQGDCPSSNYNQACMQLASYIAARYSRDEADEYEQLIEAFIQNVESSSRPTEQDKRNELNNQLQRAWMGGIKFSAGGIIATIGEPCRDCIICNKQDAEKEAKEGEFYDPATKLKFSYDAIYEIGENNSKALTNFALLPVTEYLTTNEFGQRVKDAVLATVVTQDGPITVCIPDEAFQSRKGLNEALQGSGGRFLGNDNQALYLGITLSNYMRQLETPQMERTKISGIQFVTNGEQTYPHLVTKSESYAKGNTPSNMQYVGNETYAPDFKDVGGVYNRDLDALSDAFHGLLNMNDVDLIMPIVGWVAATHLKEHLNFIGDQFPLLNACGGSHSGKSSTMYLMKTLNGFPYRHGVVWNAETATIFPLEEMVASSTTFIRMIEEANEVHAGRKWPQLVGILKANWDRVATEKGHLQGKKVVTVSKPNTAPLVYLSEQGFPIQSVRTRSVVCFFRPDGVDNPEYQQNHDLAVGNVEQLEKFAKVLCTVALNLDLKQLRKWREMAYDKVPEGYSGRTQTIYGTVLLGIEFLKAVMQSYSVEVVELIEEKTEAYLAHLKGTVAEVNREKRRSSTDDILSTFDVMASEPDNIAYGLESGKHYWRKDNLAYFDVRQCFPRYKRYARGIGAVDNSINSDVQLRELLERESYFVHTEAHPLKAGVEVHVIDLNRLREKGTTLTNLVIGDATND